MFEPKTMRDTQLIALEELLFQFMEIMPVGLRERMFEPASRYHRVMEYARAGHAQETLGPVTIPEDERANMKWVRLMLINNLGRTVFGGTIEASTLNGAIGTKSFGRKYVPWVRSLPELMLSLGADMRSGFYVHSDAAGEKELPPIYLILNTGTQLVAILVNSQTLVASQLYIQHVPANFTWGNYTMQEFFPYRADLTRAEFTTAFADALIGQGVPLIAVEDTSLELPEAITAVPFAIEAEIRASLKEQEEVQLEVASELEDDIKAEEAAVESVARDLAEAVAEPSEAGHEAQ